VIFAAVGGRTTLADGV